MLVPLSASRNFGSRRRRGVARCRVLRPHAAGDGRADTVADGRWQVGVAGPFAGRGMFGAPAAAGDAIRLRGLPVAAHPRELWRLQVAPERSPARGVQLLADGVLVRHSPSNQVQDLVSVDHYLRGGQRRDAQRVNRPARQVAAELLDTACELGGDDLAPAQRVPWSYRARGGRWRVLPAPRRSRQTAPASSGAEAPQRSGRASARYETRSASSARRQRWRTRSPGRGRGARGNSMATVFSGLSR